MTRANLELIGMSPLLRCHLVVAALLALMIAPAPVDAKPARAGQIRVAYVPPQNSSHRPMYDKLKSERWLEQLQAVLQNFRLPVPVTLKLTGCGGEVDAWFVNREVAVCYEYLHVVYRRAEASDLPAWVSGEEALAGAFVDAFLHEFSHALIEFHQIPVLGREEDAADQLATALTLEFGGARAGGLIRGTATVYLSWIKYFQGRRRTWAETKLSSGATRRDARQHSSAAQRLYNLVCLAYGADKRSYAPLAKAVELPPSRAEDCADEYRQVARAYRKLVAPHLDPTRMEDTRRAFGFFVAKR